jgi:hypothetical protein
MTGRLSLLIGAGELLYGPNWQTDIARDLGVNARLVRFWAAGKRKIPDRVLEELPGILKRRAMEQVALAEDIDRTILETVRLWKKNHER